MQTTLNEAITFNGIGLHSGKPVTMTVKPAALNTGIRITRSDIKEAGNSIQADWRYVVPSELCTLLAWKTEAGTDVQVSTIEHILSALRGANVDNVEIILDAAEVPIMDGSAIEFYKEIQRVGVDVIDASARFIRVLKTVRYERDGKYAELRPASLPSFSYELEFDAAAIGKNTHEVYLVNGNYAHDIAAARTFTTLDMVEFLRSKGLIQGGSLENAVVVDGDRVMNPEGLRFDNEFARHKSLDAIGDLYLAGAPILGAFHGYKAGHAMHTALLKELFADQSNYEFVNGTIESLPAIQAIHQKKPGINTLFTN